VSYHWKIALLGRSLLLAFLVSSPGEHLTVLLLGLGVVTDLPGRGAGAERRKMWS